MNNTSEQSINIRVPQDYKVAWYRRISGLKKLKEDRKFLITFLLLISGEIILYFKTKTYFISQNWELLGYSLVEVSKIFAIVMLIVIILLTFEFMSIPIDTAKHQRGFRRIGLYNRARQTPALIYKSKRKEITEFEYFCNGIPLSKFNEEKETIESILNLSIIDIKQGKNKSRVIITAKSGKECIPEYIEWSNSYLQKQENKIVLGIDINGLKVIDLDSTPHIQCGGSTGCGKTILLRSALYQLHKNHVRIFLADFKGGVDFRQEEKAQYNYISSKSELLEALSKLAAEMASRKKLFAESECHNITEYNKKHPDIAVERIMLASDEIAYAFQKKGLKGADKEEVESIESKMSLIAQQGRFAGIHLWLSTQRPDADTIPSQIKSNMTIRICGRASEVLSRVTIDNTRASEISIDNKGRFVDDEERFFQGFFFDDRKEGVVYD